MTTGTTYHTTLLDTCIIKPTFQHHAAISTTLQAFYHLQQYMNFPQCNAMIHTQTADTEQIDADPIFTTQCTLCNCDLTISNYK